MSRRNHNTKPHKYTGAALKSKPQAKKPPPRPIETPLLLPLKPTSPVVTNTDMIMDPEVQQRLKQVILSNIAEIEKRCDTTLPVLRSMVEHWNHLATSEALIVFDLLGHFIDTEYKLAKGILGIDYFHTWVKDARRRLRRQAKEARDKEHER